MRGLKALGRGKIVAFNDWIKTHFEMYSWSGGKKTPFGDNLRGSYLPSVDYSDDKEKPITTTIDIYVTGTYVTQKGKIFTIRERYSIEITYSNSTIIEAMSRVRSIAM